jgi:plastocyanin
MHVAVPDHDTEVKDQLEFDHTVEKQGKTVLEILAGVAVVAALGMSTVALLRSGQTTKIGIAPAALNQPVAAVPTPITTPVPAKTIYSKVVTESKMGPDHVMHDAFTNTEFAVKVGQPVKLTIDNTDEGEHSITSPVAGVNITVKPGIHTYTLIVKEKGHFQWFCIIPCDDHGHGWAMKNAGYMSGYITAS